LLRSGGVAPREPVLAAGESCDEGAVAGVLLRLWCKWRDKRAERFGAPFASTGAKVATKEPPARAEPARKQKADEGGVSCEGMRGTSRPGAANTNFGREEPSTPARSRNFLRIAQRDRRERCHSFITLYPLLLPASQTYL